MKIETDFYTEKETFILPNIIIGYSNEDKEFVFMFMFACWSFAIRFCFK